MLVTGGASGIGAACAKVFCEAGATVVICDIQDAGAYADELTRHGPGACFFQRCDVTAHDTFAQTIAGIATEHGRLDCLLNNAARFLGFRRIDDISVQDFRDLWEVNVLAYFVASQAALPYLRQSKGTIVNISSIAADVGVWRDSVYAATKGAVSSLTKALAIEEAENGVRVNAVSPGIVETPALLLAEGSVAQRREFHSVLERLNWLGRVGEPEEIARACLFLASDAASFITGITLPVTGGLELGFGLKHRFRPGQA